MLNSGFFQNLPSKYRLWTLIASLGLGVAGAFLGFSTIAAFLAPESGFAAAGSFFVRSYGLLALLIPAYLLFAAFLLAEPRYKPERIFILGGFIPPFFTLALGFYWAREFETLRLGSAFIARAGRVGVIFFVAIVAVLESLVIALLRYVFLAVAPAPESASPESGPLDSGEPSLPGENAAAFDGEGEEASWLSKAASSPGALPQNLKDIYAEAAAAMPPEPPADFEPAGNFQALPPAGASAASPVYPPAAGAFADAAGAPAANAGFDEAWGDAARVSGPAPLPAEDCEEAPGGKDSLDGNGAFPGFARAAASPPEIDEDVEKALAEAAALASELTAEEAAKHGERKNAGDAAAFAADKSSKKKRRFPYFVPVEGILKQYPDGEYWIIDEETRNAAHTLKETFKEFNIQVEVTGIRKGPVITMFEILPAPGIRLAKIENLADNIALRLAAQSVRIVAPIPGKHAVGIEVPNVKRNIVSFREIIEGELKGQGKKAEVPVVLGKDIAGEAVAVDLVQMPHLLIAGATGSGKSVCVNSMILTILYQKPPAECRLILIDPKIVELKLYNDIPHLLTPVITEPKKAFQALQYCIFEMERRYACLDSMGVRDIRSYNRRIKERDVAAEYMPYIVVVIDEFADLMATTGKELESTVARLAAMSRAVGIHLVLATQRPSIDVITGLIKANIPSRIAFMVAGRMNSQIIIDAPGAEKLLGKGDMLYAGAVDPFPIRLQGAFVSEEEVERVVDYVKSLGEPDYIDDEIFYDDEEENADPSLFSEGDDPLYDKALEIVCQQGKASASYIQRRLKIGYNRAARLVEEMERRGVVGPAQGSKPRELLRGA